jgi:hypothetical protein
MVKMIRIPQALTNAVLVVGLALVPVVTLGILATAS